MQPLVVEHAKCSAEASVEVLWCAMATRWRTPGFDFSNCNLANQLRAKLRVQTEISRSATASTNLNRVGLVLKYYDR